MDYVLVNMAVNRWIVYVVPNISYLRKRFKVRFIALK